MTALLPCCGKLPARPRDRKAKRCQRAAEMIGKRRLKTRAVGKPQLPGMKPSVAAVQHVLTANLLLLNVNVAAHGRQHSHSPASGARQRPSGPFRAETFPSSSTHVCCFEVYVLIV